MQLTPYKAPQKIPPCLLTGQHKLIVFFFSFWPFRFFQLHNGWTTWKTRIFSRLLYVALAMTPPGKKGRKKMHAPHRKRKRPSIEVDLCAQVLWANQHSIDLMASLKWDGRTDTWLDIMGMKCSQVKHGNEGCILSHMVCPQRV